MCFAVAFLMSLSSVVATGQTFDVLHRFNINTDGAQPQGGLIADQAGNLYGTTTGYTNTTNGTVYELSPPTTGDAWTETVLFSFAPVTRGNSPCGSYPSGGLVFDQAGNLYGTATFGGTLGFGTVFRLTPPTLRGGAWTCDVVYDFRGDKDAANPSSRLIFDQSGNLYGTTAFAGAYGSGAVYRLSPSSSRGGAWTETVLHSFQYSIYNNHDGWFPNGLVLGSNGALYGTTQNGGKYDKGIVFKLIPPSADHPAWIEDVLYDFTGGSDGGIPASSMIFDRGNNLYGTAEYGGTGTCYAGCGVVFQLSPPATTDGAWTESVLYDFTAGSDGSLPYAPLIFDSAGNLFGTTDGTDTCNVVGGCGAVVELTPPATQGGAWTETTLHTFTGGRDQGGQVSGLTFGRGHRLYGTTGPLGVHQYGTIFAVAP